MRTKRTTDKPHEAPMCLWIYQLIEPANKQQQFHWDYALNDDLYSLKLIEICLDFLLLRMLIFFPPLHWDFAFYRICLS